MTVSNPKPTTPRSRKRSWTKILIALLAFAALWLVGIRLSRSPDHEKIFAEARTALAVGDMDAVTRALKVLRDDAKYARHCNLLEGGLLLRNGDFAESLVSFREAAREPVLEVDALTFAGQAQYQMNRVAEAHQLWGTALRLNPASVETHRWLAVLYYDLGAMDQALEHLEKVSKLAPEDPRPDRLMGSIYKDFEKYQQAADHYQTSLQRGPDQQGRDEMLLELAESQTKSSDFKGALETLARCPDSVDRIGLQAECHYALGDSAQALNLTARALELAPEHLASALLRAKIFLGEGRAGEAIDLLEKTAGLHPKDYLVRYTLSQAYIAAGDQTKAQAALDESEALKKVWQEFSRLNTEAINQPLNVKIRYDLGVLARELERPDLAKSWFRAALSLDPSHQQAAEALAEFTENE